MGFRSFPSGDLPSHYSRQRLFVEDPPFGAVGPSRRQVPVSPWRVGRCPQRDRASNFHHYSVIKPRNRSSTLPKLGIATIIGRPCRPIVFSWNDEAASQFMINTDWMEVPVPRGDKSSYSDKQKRMAEHIEEGYEKRGVSEGEAERRAWATVNKETHGGQEERLGPW